MVLVAGGSTDFSSGYVFGDLTVQNQFVLDFTSGLTDVGLSSPPSSSSSLLSYFTRNSSVNSLNLYSDQLQGAYFFHSADGTKVTFDSSSIGPSFLQVIPMQNLANQVVLATAPALDKVICVTSTAPYALFLSTNLVDPNAIHPEFFNSSAAVPSFSTGDSSLLIFILLISGALLLTVFIAIGSIYFLRKSALKSNNNYFLDENDPLISRYDRYSDNNFNFTKL